MCRTSACSELNPDGPALRAIRRWPLRMAVKVHAYAGGFFSVPRRLGSRMMPPPRVCSGDSRRTINLSLQRPRWAFLFATVPSDVDRVEGMLSRHEPLPGPRVPTSSRTWLPVPIMGALFRSEPQSKMDAGNCLVAAPPCRGSSRLVQFSQTMAVRCPACASFTESPWTCIPRLGVTPKG